jgi:hypothetical protein
MLIVRGRINEITHKTVIAIFIPYRPRWVWWNLGEKK